MQQNVTKLVDQTFLKEGAGEEEIRKVAEEAKKYGFRSVCVNPRWASLAKKELGGTGIKVVTVIDWPIGASPTEVRVFAAQQAKKDGADEIDPVLDIGDFKAGNYKDILEDLKSLAKILPTKLIIETGYLSDEEIKKAASLVKKAGCYCVKTSTGMEPKVDIETKINHIRLIREAVGSYFPIKAAGGIKTMEDAQKLVEVGANIIGTSNGVEIVIGASSKSSY